MTRFCKCPEKAQIEIPTYGDPRLMICNCCGRTWRRPEPEIDPWLRPGHVCTCGEG